MWSNLILLTKFMGKVQFVVKDKNFFVKVFIKSAMSHQFLSAPYSWICLGTVPTASKVSNVPS